MFKKIGRGLGPVKMQGNQLETAFQMYGPLPSGFAYTRADSVATTRNSLGKLVTVAANTPRFDYDAQGTALGLLMEGAVTNKCTNHNVNPAATTNMTKGGDAAATLSVVSDAPALASAKLDAICTNGMVFKLDNTSGTATAYVDIGGATAAATPHSFSVWARGSGAAPGTLTRTGTGANAITFTGDVAYQRYVLAAETPNPAAVSLRITANAGRIVWFVLNQLEDVSFATSEIVVAGAAATRAADRLTYALSGKKWFSGTQGYFGIRYRTRGLLPATAQYLLVADNGSGSNDTLGLRINASTHNVCSYVRAGGVSQSTVTNNDVQVAGCMNAAGITWSNGQATIVSGGKVDTRTYASNPSGISVLNIGARTSGLEPFFGHITKIVMGAQAKTVTALGARLHEAGDAAVIGAGQSLVVGYFQSQQSASEAGKQKFREVAGLAKKTKVVTFLNGATGGSAASSTSDGANYWWDLSASARGPALNAFYAAVSSAGVVPTAVLFGLGETDSGAIKNGLTTKAQYKNAMLAIFADIRASYGNIPIILQKIGRRTGLEYAGAIQAVREAQEELIDELDYVHRGAEVYDTTLYDTVHPNDAGFILMAERNARKVANLFGAVLAGVDGPHMVSASRAGASVTVTIGHDGGTDIAPAASIQGFHFFDGTSEIAVTAATRASSGSINLTLASAPSGTSGILKYIYDKEETVTLANLVHDNASPNMPLRAHSLVF